jgi:hypothetical protein
LRVVDCGAPEVLGYIRAHKDEVAYAICINFSDQKIPCQLPVAFDECLISSAGVERSLDSPTHFLDLEPYEAVVCKIYENEA